MSSPFAGGNPPYREATMDMYTAAMGNAYRSTPGVFGRLDYHPQPERQTQRHRHQQQQQQHQHQQPPPPPQQQQQPVTPGSAKMTPDKQNAMGQFGILAPTPMPVPPAHQQMTPMQQSLSFAPESPAPTAPGKLGGKIVVDPPDLESWREKLFNVDEMIVLTHEQFETYFPHVDNVYSHRSTQRYKRKPFVSHYWDCRMKGRPPGTPKTEDPSKKRRQRSTRERDLCDVKIKITEYFPGAEAFQLDGVAAQAAAAVAGYEGQRFWTIQRVNGNGGNGKGDGVAGPHKHTLARSDEIKKNSVQRYVAQQDKETKKAVPPRRTSGAAAATAKKHTKDNDLKLYASCYCPFSQRVWITLEAKGMAYQYCETDPYRRPAPPSLLEANPRGRVPAIRQGEWACAESSVILEYLEDFNARVPLLPSDARLRANCRLWIDHINTNIVPAFYALLQGNEAARRNDLIDRLQTHINSLVQAADEDGPLFLGSSLSLVDVHIAPFAQRLRRILEPRRGWPAAKQSPRWVAWLDALEQEASVAATTSQDELYADSADVLIQNPPPVAIS